VIRPFLSHNNFINEFYIKYSGFELIRLIAFVCAYCHYQ
jgi:hypothetical protein